VSIYYCDVTLPYLYSSHKAAESELVVCDVCVVCDVLGGMVTIPVIDVCQVSVQPPARSVPVNCPAVTRVVTAAAGEAELAVTVKCTSAKTQFITHLNDYDALQMLTYLFNLKTVIQLTLTLSGPCSENC